jgi:threonyl-tRNA synthetase
MVAITLPDGSVRAFEGPVTGAQIAGAIGPRLAKDALALRLNGAVLDLATEVEQDSAIEIVARGHADALELLRHDCAHVMAEAVQELYPDTLRSRTGSFTTLPATSPSPRTTWR